MSETISLKVDDVKRLVYKQQNIQSKRVSLGNIYEVTQALNKLASEFDYASSCLEDRWEAFSADERKFLVEYAYRLIEPGNSVVDELAYGGFTETFFSNPIKLAQYFCNAFALRLKHRYSFYQIFSNYLYAVKHFDDAKHGLVDFILNMVERDNPDYHQFSYCILEELEQLQGECSSELNSFKPSEIDGWLQR